MKKNYEKEILTILEGVDVYSAKKILETILSRLDVNSVVTTVS